MFFFAQESTIDDFCKVLITFLARLLILIKKGGLLQLKFGVVGVGVGVSVGVGVNIYLWAR